MQRTQTPEEVELCRRIDTLTLELKISRAKRDLADLQQQLLEQPYR